MFVNYITYMLHIMSSFSISDPGLHKVYLVDFFFFNRLTTQMHI